MFIITTDIRLGKHGVILIDATRETFVASEIFDNFHIYRIGCRIYFNGKGKRGATFFHFKYLQDAIDLMDWIAGHGISEEVR